MENKNALMGAMGLCRKAGKLVRGFDTVQENVMKGKVFLVLVAADTSPKTARKVYEFCEGLVPCVALPLTQEELLGISGKAVGVYAVADENLAMLCEKHLNIKEDNIE